MRSGKITLGDDQEDIPKPADRVFFDCDLFLESNQAIELYVTAAYPDPEADPVVGISHIQDVIGFDGNLELIDYGGVDKEGGLALAFGHDEHVHLVLAAGPRGWSANGSLR